MRFIEQRVSEGAAIQFFQRRRFANLWGLLGGRRLARGPSSERTPKQLPRVELVWMPYYLIGVQVTSRRGPGQIDVCVEGHSAAFAIFERRGNLVEGEPDGEAFPPKLGEQEAITIGRKELLKAIMRRRSQRDKPVIEGALGAELFYYPFWVYYFERRKGLIDIRLQDALTGESGGNRTKAGVLSAFKTVNEETTT